MAKLYATRAHLAWIGGDHKEALRLLREAIEVREGEEYAYALEYTILDQIAHARILIETGEIEDARATLQAMAQAHPEALHESSSWLFHHARTALRLADGDYIGAIEAAETARRYRQLDLAQDTYDAFIFADLARAHSKLQQTDQAGEYAKRAHARFARWLGASHRLTLEMADW